MNYALLGFLIGLLIGLQILSGYLLIKAANLWAMGRDDDE